MAPTTVPISKPPNLCPICGCEIAGDHPRCPQCDTELTAFDHRPLAIHTSQETFAPTTNVIFEFTPSGICISHPLQSLLILGRALGPAPAELLDLTPFDGHKLGV